MLVFFGWGLCLVVLYILVKLKDFIESPQCITCPINQRRSCASRSRSKVSVLDCSGSNLGCAINNCPSKQMRPAFPCGTKQCGCPSQCECPPPDLMSCLNRSPFTSSCSLKSKRSCKELEKEQDTLKAKVDAQQRRDDLLSLLREAATPSTCSGSKTCKPGPCGKKKKSSCKISPSDSCRSCELGFKPPDCSQCTNPAPRPKKIGSSNKTRKMCSNLNANVRW